MTQTTTLATNKYFREGGRDPRGRRTRGRVTVTALMVRRRKLLCFDHSTFYPHLALFPVPLQPTASVVALLAVTDVISKFSFYRVPTERWLRQWRDASDRGHIAQSIMHCTLHRDDSVSDYGFKAVRHGHLVMVMVMVMVMVHVNDICGNFDLCDFQSTWSTWSADCSRFPRVASLKS